MKTIFFPSVSTLSREICHSANWCSLQRRLTFAWSLNLKALSVDGSIFTLLNRSPTPPHNDSNLSFCSLANNRIVTSVSSVYPMDASFEFILDFLAVKCIFSVSAYLIGILLAKRPLEWKSRLFLFFVIVFPLKKKRGQRGSSIRGSFCGGTRGDAARWNPTEGPNNRTILHGNCVPVGCSEPQCCSSRLVSHGWPQRCLGSLRRGGGGLSQRVHCGSLPSYSQLDI